MKGHALEQVLSSGSWPSEESRQYAASRAEHTLFCPMIESPEGIRNLDRICALDGIDAVFVGPNDQTTGMGIPEQRDHPDFVSAVQQVVETAERHGVAGGAHFSVEAHTRRLIEQGGRFIPFSSDMRMIQGGTADLVNRIRTRETVAT